MSKLGEYARGWLLELDPEGSSLWMRASDKGCIEAMEDNLRDFGRGGLPVIGPEPSRGRKRPRKAGAR